MKINIYSLFLWAKKISIHYIINNVLTDSRNYLSDEAIDILIIIIFK